MTPCGGCTSLGVSCIFLEESEQCVECQKRVRRCEGSVDHEELKQVDTEIEQVLGEMDEILERELPDGESFKALKESLITLKKDTAKCRKQARKFKGSVPYEIFRRVDEVTYGARRAFAQIRDGSLPENSAYQKLKERYAALTERSGYMWQREGLYIDELDEITGYPRCRGLPSSEDLDDDAFKEALEWTRQNPGGWRNFPEPETHTDDDSSDEDEEQERRLDDVVMT